MKNRTVTIALILVALCGVGAFGEDDLPRLVEEALARAGVEVRATLKGQQFDVHAGKINQLIIRVNDRMLNLDEDVTVTSQAKELYKGRIQRSIGTLAKTLDQRGDPAAIFSGEIVVTLTKKTAM